MTGNRPHSLHRRLRVHEAIPATTSALERLRVFRMVMSIVESNLCKSQAESLADGAAFFSLVSAHQGSVALSARWKWLKQHLLGCGKRRNKELNV